MILGILKTMVCAVALATLAVPAWAGIYFEQTVTTKGQGGQGMEMLVHGWAEGDQAKIKYVESNNPVMSAGTYLLTRDGGETVYLVNPEKKSYSEFDLAKVFSLFGQMQEMTGGMFKLDFQDPVSETLGSEPGGAILGYPTTHYTWKSGYTMAMKMAFIEQTNRSLTTTDAWVTTALDTPGLFAWLRATPPTTGDPELDAVLTAGMERVDGVVLKMDAHTVTTNKKGKSHASTTHYEVTTLREENVDDSIFAMPTGYTETPFMAGMESSATAQGEQPAAKDEDRGRLDRLKGLFGGKKGKKKDD